MSQPEKNPYQHPVKHAIGVGARIFFNSLANLVSDRRFDPAFIEITRHTISLPGLHPDFAGYRILQLSDFHMGTWMNLERLQGCLDLAMSQPADLIVITGDFITHATDGLLDSMVAPLRGLQAPDGVLAVLGNHDYWSDPGQVREMLHRSAIQELRNQAVVLARGAGRLYIAGLDDTYNRQDRLDLLLDQLPGDDPAVLLVHVPDYADHAAAAGRFALQLSGHSHGGQIVFPWFDALILPPHGRKYVRGLRRVQGMWLYTNRGLGTSTVPIRLNCRPEIAVFELQPG
jgi:hypothetical protein